MASRRPIYILCLLMASFVACSARKYLKSFDVEAPEAKDEMIEPTRITAGMEANFLPDLSPNGAFVLYTSDRSGNKNIWEKKVNGGTSTMLTTHTADDFSAVISPNGKRAAFVSRRSDAAGDIHVMDLGDSVAKVLGSDEGTVERIKLEASEDLNPAWFPDSDRLVFTARRAGDVFPKLMLADLDDLKATEIEGIQGEQPNVSNDGEWIVYVKNGALFAFEIKTKKTIQLTNGGSVQDGQPRFSADDKHIVFIRYGDDTNSDGKLDGDDRPTLWRLDVELQNKNSDNLENYSLAPLTSADFGAYSPSLRAPLLYFTRQSGDGLAIFSLPSDGQMQAGETLDTVKKQLDGLETDNEKTYLLRKAQNKFQTIGNVDALQMVALWELQRLVESHRMAEAQWVATKIKKNFAKNNATLASVEISLIELEVGALLYPYYNGELNDLEMRLMGEKNAQLSELEQKFQATDEPSQEVLIKAMLLRSKVLAAQKLFAEANELLEAIAQKNRNLSETVAKAALYRAQISSVLSNQKTAIELYKNVIRDFPQFKDIVLQAAKDAVSTVASDATNPVPALIKLRSDTSSLAPLPALAHRRVVDEYISKDKNNLAINELREMLELYPASPDIVIDAARTLIELEEKRATNLDQLEQLLEKLVADFSSADKKNRQAVEALLTEYLLRKAESLMREREPALASKEYRKVLKRVPENINAEIGMIDARQQLNELDTEIETLKSELRDNPNSAIRNFYLAYALDYKVETAKEIPEKLQTIDDCILLLEKARSRDAHVAVIHQTLGRLYEEKAAWQKKYYTSNSLAGAATRRWKLVKDYFGSSEPNWQELAIDAYLSAYFLTNENTIERANLVHSLGETFYDVGNFSKSLNYYMRRIEMLSSFPMRDKKAEAMMYRKTGRSAFQIEDLKVAEALQRRALETWNDLGVETEVARSLDALGLTLRDGGKFTETIPVYLRLLRIQSRIRNAYNNIGTLINLGYVYFESKKYDKSLSYLNDALTELDAFDERTLKPEDSTAIQVDLGGQGSLAKGFDPFTRRILILTYKERVYAKIERYDLELKTIQQKYALMEEQRLVKIKSGLNEKFYAEELSVVANNIGELKNNQGDFEDASKFYLAASDYAKLTRSTEEDIMDRGEWLNFTNYARMQLKLADLGILNNKKLATFQEKLGDAIGAFRKASEKNPENKAILKPLAALLAIQGELQASILKQDVEKNQKTLAEVKKLSLQVPASGKIANGALMNFDFEGIANPKKSLITQRAIFRKNALQLPELEWKYYARRGLWLQASNAVQNFIANGSYLKTPNDRLLARIVFENRFRATIDDETQAAKSYQELRQYLYVKNMDLAHRLFNYRHEKNPSSLIDKTRPLITIKRQQNIGAVLDDDEAVLTVHNTMDGEVIAFLQQRQRLDKSVVAAKDLPQGVASVCEELLGTNGATIKRLYIAPSGDLFKLPWETLKYQGSSLNSHFTLSFISSPDWLPELVRIRKLPKGAIGHLAFEKARDPKVIKKANSARDYRLIKVSKAKSDPFGLNEFNIVHSDAPVDINNLEPIYSVIRGPELEEKTYQDYDFNLKTLASFDLPNTTALVLANNTFDRVLRRDSDDDDYGWIALGLTGYAAKIPSILVATNEENSDEAWGQFYKELDQDSFAGALLSSGLKARIIGYSGVPVDKERQIASERIKTALAEGETALDEGRLAAAILLYKEGLYYAQRLGMDARIDTILEVLSQLHVALGDYEGAYHFRNEMVVRASARHLDSKSLDELMLAAAEVAIQARMFAPADSLLTATEKNAKSKNDFRTLGQIASLRGDNHRNQRSFKEAGQAYEDARQFFLKAGIKVRAALQQINMGILWRDHLNENVKALTLFKTAAADLKGLASPSDYHQALLEEARTYLNLHDLRPCLKILEFVRQNTDRSEDLQTWQEVSLQLAAAFDEAALSSQSQAILDDVRDSLSEVKDQSKRVNMKLAVDGQNAELLAKRGKMEDSLRIMSEVIFEAKNLGLKEKLTSGYRHIGIWQRRFGNFNESLSYLETSVQINQKLKLDEAMVEDQRNLAETYALSGDLAKAKALVDATLKKSREFNLALAEIRGLLTSADIAIKDKDYERAVSQFTLAIAAAKKIDAQDYAWRAYHGLGIALTKRGDKAGALDALANAADTIEKQNPGLMVQSLESEFHLYSGTAQLYEDYVDALMKDKQVEKAWLVSERYRQRSFVDTVAVQMTKADPKSPRFREMFDNVPLSLADLKAKMSKEEALVTYFQTADNLHIWAVRDGQLLGATNAVSRVKMREKLDEFRGLLQDFSTTRYLGEELTGILISPVIKSVSDAKQVIIVPHGDLNYFSFAALSLDSGFLIDRYSISYLPAASLLGKSNTARNLPENKNTKVLTVIDSERDEKTEMPFIDREVAAIGRFYKTEAVDSLKIVSAGADILHIAGSSSQVSARDILTSQQPAADLVVFSGDDNEIAGLDQTFLSLGTKDIVSNLWRLDDVTSAMLVKKFYRNLAAGLTRSDALRSSQLELKKSYPHPAYWAGYRMTTKTSNSSE